MSETESPPPQRSKHSLFFWLSLATIALLASAGTLMLWLPHHQRSAVIAEIESRGGAVRVQPAALIWLEQYFDANQLGVFDEVQFIDLMDAEFGDDDIDMLLELPETKGLTIRAPALTDAGILKLQHLKSLRMVMIVNCPHVSAEAIKELKTQLPGLELIRRGDAFLGIAGMTTPVGWCQVQHVVPGAAAALAGVRSGDRIAAVDGRPIFTYDELTDYLNERHPGETVRLKLRRDGDSQPIDVEAKLGSWPSATQVP